MPSACICPKIIVPLRVIYLSFKDKSKKTTKKSIKIDEKSSFFDNHNASEHYAECVCLE
jgi:hypothetical protein